MTLAKYEPSSFRREIAIDMEETVLSCVCFIICEERICGFVYLLLLL